MFISSIVGSLLWKTVAGAVTGILAPILNIVSAILSPIFKSIMKLLRSFKLTLDGVVILLIVLTCAGGGWAIAKISKESGRQSERAALEKAWKEVKKQVTTYVKERKGEVSANAAERDEIGKEIKSILDDIPETVVQTKEVPGETITIQVPVVTIIEGGKKVSVPVHPFNPDYPPKLNDALNKLNIKK